MYYFGDRVICHTIPDRVFTVICHLNESIVACRQDGYEYDDCLDNEDLNNLDFHPLFVDTISPLSGNEE